MSTIRKSFREINTIVNKHCDNYLKHKLTLHSLKQVIIFALGSSPGDCITKLKTLTNKIKYFFESIKQQIHIHYQIVVPPTMQRRWSVAVKRTLPQCSLKQLMTHMADLVVVSTFLTNLHIPEQIST